MTMIESLVVRKAKSVKAASAVLATLSTERKNELLRRINEFLLKESESIQAANAKDVRRARRAGVSKVIVDRLTLDRKRIEQMVRGVEDVIALPDAVGRVLATVTRPNGLRIEKISVPIGSIGIIYEARPNVTIDASVLCLKSGNSVMLRGGSEAIITNRKLVEVIRMALVSCGLPQGCVEYVDTTDRKAVRVMLKQDRYLDVIIPRGSHALIRFIQEKSSVPVIAHGEGNCHVYVDATADPASAAEIVFNAKVQRPSVCNAAEKLLVHERIARTFLPLAVERLRGAGVEVRGDRKTRAIVKDARPASEADWTKEYLDLIIAVRVVRDVDEAIAHINEYGSHHSDSIVTGTPDAGERFLREVDSAAVYVNASTRFTDGFEFGLGAEIGISTQKLHARGPMGLAELTSTKFVVRGSGQVRA